MAVHSGGGGDGPGTTGVGLVCRPRFAQMAGSFGYGRALHSRQPIRLLADWDPPVLRADATVQQAAAAVLGRPDGARYDGVLVPGEPGPDGQPRWSVVSVPDLFHALAGDFAHQAHDDVLTGLANRELFFARLRAVCR